MATLPDGTAVNSQTVEAWNIDPPTSFTSRTAEGWNIDPPTSFTSRTAEGWNIDPPPVAGINIAPNPQTVSIGGTITVSGSVTIDGTAAQDQNVKISVAGPSSIDTPAAVTDAAGDYQQTLGPFETPGDYDVTAQVNGIQEQATEGWNI